MMKSKRPTPNQKLQASARRAATMDDYDEEPSMKLSSAFVVVLLLHLVAVGGIYAFTRIKEHRASTADPFPQEQPAALADEQTPEAGPPRQGRVYEVRPGDTLIRIANSYGVGIEAIEKANGLHDVEVLRVGQEIRIPDPGVSKASPPRQLVSEPAAKKFVAPSQASSSSGSSADSGQTYKVEKGDNPVAIARKLKVRYSDLIELNKIDDPRLLQIGQVLKIPAARD